MKKYILSLFFLISCVLNTYAHTEKQQQEKIEISGIVLDQNKEPLVGVNVSVKDIPGLGAITDINGKFKIKVEPYQWLVFTFIGFDKQEILVKEQKSINVIMQEAKATAIDEVVSTEKNYNDWSGYYSRCKYTENFHFKHYKCVGW